MCYVHVKNKKTIHFLALLTWFLLLGKIQDGSLDGNHVLWRYRPAATPPPIKYTSSCREDQRLSTGSKIVSKYCSISKTRAGDRGSINPFPLKPWWGYDFSCTSEGIKSDQRVWETSRWKSVSKAWAYAAKSHSTSTQEYIGAKTVRHDIPCTVSKGFWSLNLARRRIQD